MGINSYGKGLVLACGVLLSVFTIAAWAVTLEASEHPSAQLQAARQNYQMHCAVCHGTDRLGGTGPALLPESLARIKREQSLEVITHGRAATQMLAFENLLSAQEIEDLVDFLYAPTAEVPEWTAEKIQAHHQVFDATASADDRPIHNADPMNLFVVVESGNHHVNILDGDSFEIITRFPSHFALHGGPKFSPDGRFVYFASRDGWINKYDLHRLTMVAETRAGLNTRNLAVSSDGKWVLVGNYLPGTLVLLDAEDLSLVHILDAQSQEGVASRVSAVYNSPHRQSFIVALKDIPEVWELSYEQGQRPDQSLRRIIAQDLLDDFSFTPEHRYLLATSRKAQGGQVIDMQTGEVVTDIPLPGMPHLGSGIYWPHQDGWVFATPNISQGLITVLDIGSWEVIKEIPTEGPGFFMRSHVNSKYAWTDVFFGPNFEAVHLIDKQSLELAHTLRPMPGKNAAHVEFTRDGSHLILSVWDEEGALIVYDSDTLKEIKRIPMNKPSGKYNVGNKTEYAEGTSH